MDFNYLTAPCGVDCFNCEFFRNNITKRSKIRLIKNFGSNVLSCEGCRSENGCMYHNKNCDILKCVNEKGYYFCYECNLFPCSKYEGEKENNQLYSPNMKKQNLYYIKKNGINKWRIHSKKNRKKLLEKIKKNKKKRILKIKK